MKRQKKPGITKAVVSEIKVKLAQAGVQVSNGKVNKKAALKALGTAKGVVGAKGKYGKLLWSSESIGFMENIHEYLNKIIELVRKHEKAFFGEDIDGYVLLLEPSEKSKASHAFSNEDGAWLSVADLENID